MFFNRKAQEEEPKIKFYTSVPGVAELTPPVPMRKAMPRWMKDTPLRCPVGNIQGPHGAHPTLPPLPSNVPDGQTTIKACAGVIDIMKWGYMIPLWADHEMITDPSSMETNRYQLKAISAEYKTGGFGPHHSDKMPRKENEYEFSPKLDSPWCIVTPPGYSIALLPLPLHDDEFTVPWRIVPGIVDTDRYHNFNIVLKWGFMGRYIIEQGTPMCAVVPFKRDTTEIPMEIHEVDSDTMNRLKARGKGGTSGGDRMITMPYQKWRKQQELNERH